MMDLAYNITYNKVSKTKVCIIASYHLTIQIKGSDNIIQFVIQQPR